MKTQRPKFPKLQKSSFSITYLLPHLIFIAILMGGYYYISTHNLFYNYLPQIYIGIKILIACDIFVTSISSTLSPLLVLIAGLAIMYLTHNYEFSILAESWQLLIMAGVGFIIRILVR